MRSNIFLIFALLICNQKVTCQELDKKTEYSYQASFTIESHFLQESRPIEVQLPKGYYDSGRQSYPVLYVLDGQNLFTHTCLIYNFLQSKDYIPEMILVSIPHTGQRNRDYKTFFRGTEIVNKGADNFLSFIEQELITFIDKNYRTASYKMLSGHSNSGLFVIHSLIKRPALFNARFAFSPSSHHIPKQRQLLKQFLIDNPNLVSYFYMNVGGKEFFKQTDSFAEIKQLFKNYSPIGLRYDFDLHDADGHRSSPFVGQNTAFKRLYNPLRLGTDFDRYSFTEMVQHFDKLSTEFGHEVKPSEKELLSMAHYYLTIVPKPDVLKNLVKLMRTYYPQSKQLIGNALFYENWVQSGISSHVSYPKTKKPDENILNKTAYWYLSNHKLTEAIYLFKLAIKLYPESSNPHDSLGDAYKVSGNLKSAWKSYQQAYRMAKKNHEELKIIEAYKNNMDQTQKQLKETVE